MNSDADKTWIRAIGKLRRKKGYSPLTPQEAEAAYESAPSVPLSAARIGEIVKSATGSSPVRIVRDQETRQSPGTMAGEESQRERIIYVGGLLHGLLYRIDDCLADRRSADARAIVQSMIQIAETMVFHRQLTPDVPGPKDGA